MNENTQINYTFTIGEINLILAALSKQPYEAVAPMINKIQETANAQLAPTQETAAEANMPIA